MKSVSSRRPSAACLVLMMAASISDLTGTVGSASVSLGPDSDSGNAAVASSYPSAVINQSFRGYKVLRAVPEDADAVAALRSLVSNTMFDFWTYPTAALVPVDIMSPPEELRSLEDTLKAKEIAFTVMMDDLDEKIESTMSTDSARSPIADFTFAEYHPTAVIYRQLDEWAANFPDLVTVTSIGESAQEKKEIKLLAIKAAPAVGAGAKPAMFLDGGIHAREWISPATVMYVARQLLNAKDNEKTRGLLDSFDWYLVPVLNPDGYDFSHAALRNRLWRKNRAGANNRAASGLFGRTIFDQINNGLSNSVCPGVDLNRNFAFQWRVGGASQFPCSEIYAGPSAGSESETKALSDFLLQNKDSIKSYISFHSYGRAILTPWGYTRTNPETFSDLTRMGGVFRDAVAASAKADGRLSSYSLGTAANLLYVAAGCSDDFAFGQAKIPYAYTIELPDEGTFGFLMPPSQIPIIGKETFAGLVAYSKELARTLKKKL